MDEAMKKPTKRRFRKQDGIVWHSLLFHSLLFEVLLWMLTMPQDLESMADAEIEDMRKRMTHAAQMDAINRQEGKPAMHKLKLLPEVIMLLNRNQYISSLVDPEINLLEAVRFFLEPLDDGSMPAYNIQRDLLIALNKLPINKDALIASGIGKVIVFYTKSKRTERRIKEMAEKLLAEWTRPILQRSDDYSKRVYQQADFDPTYVHVLRVLIATDNLGKSPSAPQRPPRWSLPKRAPARSCPLVWPIGPESIVLRSATLWSRGRQACKRTDSRGRWAPAAKTVSVRCKRDSTRHRKRLVGKLGSYACSAVRYFLLLYIGCVSGVRDSSGWFWGGIV